MVVPKEELEKECNRCIQTYDQRLKEWKKYHEFGTVEEVDYALTKGIEMGEKALKNFDKIDDLETEIQNKNIQLEEANNTIKMYEEKIIELNRKLDENHKLLFGE